MGKRTNWPATILVAFGSILILFPLYLTVVIAFKDPKQMAESLLALPRVWRWENFGKAIEMTNFYRSFKNSFFLTVVATVFTILTNSMVAYAIARNFHKRIYKFLYFYFISAMFIPFPIIMLPIVKLMSNLGIDNQFGLAFLYVVYGLAFNIFLYVGYLKSLPVELEEAAIVDGCSVWKLFWKVVFPLMAPINATVGVLTVLWVWNDFLLPLVMLSRPDQMTLPLVQFVFQSQFDTNYNLAFASYLMVLSPVIVVYIIAQKWIISGVMRGAIKG